MNNQNNEMMQEIINNLEVAEMLLDGGPDECDQRAIKESIAAALTDLNQLAELSVMPGSGVIQ